MSDYVYCHWLEGECFDYIGKCFNCEIRKKKMCEKCGLNLEKQLGKGD